MTIQQAKSFGINELKSSPSPQLDADVLLQSITGFSKTELLFKRDITLTDEQEALYINCITKRKTGLPVAYITGRKEFFGYNFTVSPDVLIPKPDTEILVEQAVNLLEDKIHSYSSDKILTICDMCTGSGCVGLSILKYAVENRIVTEQNMPLLILADISEKALNVARQNVENLATDAMKEKIRFIRTNLFHQVTGSFDIIVSNPPYIPSRDAHNLLTDGRNEPILALDGDIDIEGNPTGENDGLGIMRNLVFQAVEHLNPEGVLLCESGEYNAEMTEWIFRNNGLHSTKIHRDLEGQLRVTEGHR